MKVLLTSGCSFTECYGWDDNHNPDNRTWPIWLREKLTDRTHYSEGFGGQGNNLIAQRTQYRIEQLLKTHQPNDILVGIMWSGSDRWECYKTEDHDFPRVLGELHNPIKFIEPVPNITTGSWIMMHPQYIHEHNDLFYKKFYDPVWMQIMTLQSIIHTQRYLREKGINYFMSQAFNTCLDRGRRNDVNTSWLWDQIDFDTWLPVDSMKEWCDQNCPIPNVNNFHPRSEQCEQFVNQVVVPWLTEKNLF